MSALGLAAVIYSGAGPAERITGLAASILIGALAAAALWFARHPPVMLTIGPEGVRVPHLWRAPLAWPDIHRIRRIDSGHRLTGRLIWLRIDPSPGVLPDYRLSSPRRLELWYTGKVGLRLPIHALDQPPATVIASVERFRPVKQPD